MVRLHVKHGEEDQFLFETTTTVQISSLCEELLKIYNGRLKIDRLCGEIENLADHGVCLPPNMQGLTDEQVTELKLKDEWGEKCVPSGGAEYKQDQIGRRNGKAPNAKMAEVLKNTVKEAKANVTKKHVEANIAMTEQKIKDTIDILRGAVTIVYPMGLPPYDPIKDEFEDIEDLTGTQASLQVIAPGGAVIWWAGKELLPDKKLADYIGKNEKTKIKVKLQKKGSGAPQREAVITEEEKKKMMLQAYRRQEELKKLEEMEDDSHLDSNWADNKILQRQFQGLNNISWRPGKKM